LPGNYTNGTTFRYAVHMIQMLSAPSYRGDYLVDFVRAKGGTNLAEMSTPTAHVGTFTLRDGGRGEWNIERATDIGANHAAIPITGLTPQTTYEMRWVSVGVEGDTVNGPSGTFTTTASDVDAMIRNVGDEDYVGENIYSLNGSGQTTGQWTSPGRAVEYEVRVKNNAPVSQGVTVKGPGSDDNWNVTYWDEQNVDITEEVSGTGWTIAALAAGGSRVVKVSVVPNGAGAVGVAKDVLVTALVTADQLQKDGVKATTTGVGQTIAKMQYSLDDGETWQDVPHPGQANYPLTVDQRTYVDFRAVKSNPDDLLPKVIPLKCRISPSDFVARLLAACCSGRCAA